MSDLKLSDGREVDIDLYQISQKEIRHWFFDPQVPDEDADAYMVKVTGLKDVGDLPAPDYSRIVTEVFAKYRNPISDPNSLSESSSSTKKGAKNQSD